MSELSLPPEIAEIIARQKAEGISYTMDRTLTPAKITSIHLHDATPPDPLAEAIKGQVGDDYTPLIIDGQWFIIRRTTPDHLS